MNFQKKYIPSHTLCLIHIESRKVSLCYISLKNSECHILFYKEKRINSDIFSWYTCKKKQQLLNIFLDIHAQYLSHCLPQPDYSVFSSYEGSTQNTFSEVHYSHKNNTPIDDHIFREVLQHAWNIYETKKNIGVSLWENTTIFSRIEHCDIDGKRTSSPLGKTGNHIQTKIFYSAIPWTLKKLYDEISYILWVQTLAIIPREYILPKLFSHKDMLSLFLESDTCHICIKKWWEYLGIRSVHIGTRDLLEKIQKTHTASLVHIQENITKYQKEQCSFFDILEQWVTISIQDILWKNLCPKNIHISCEILPNETLHWFIRKMTEKHAYLFLSESTCFIEKNYSQYLHSLGKSSLQEISSLSAMMYALIEETRQHLLLSHKKSSSILQQVAKEKIWL